MSNRSLFIPACLVALCCWLPGAQSFAQVATPASAAATGVSGNPVKIGLIGPFSGPSADFGVPMLNGVQQAIGEINAVGGYLGRPIQLVIKDDQANPDVGLKMSQELVKDNVVATVGFCNTGVAAKSLEVFQTSKVPLIIPCATGTPLTAKYPGPESFIFRNSAKDGIQAPFVIEDIIKRGWTKVAIFADTTGYGTAGLLDVESALASRQLKPVHVARFALGVTNLDDELRAAKAAGANVIFSYTVGSENAVIAKGRKALGGPCPRSALGRCRSRSSLTVPKTRQTAHSWRRPSSPSPATSGAPRFWSAMLVATRSRRSPFRWRPPKATMLPIYWFTRCSAFGMAT